MTARSGRGKEHYVLLDTPFGACGIAWGARGLVRLQLPEATVAATRARVARDGCNPWVGPLPPQATCAVASLERYFGGDAEDFSAVEVDLGDVPAFHREVYGALRKIPWGETTTYGALARRVGGAARAIGQAMGRNPVPVIIPCHRVLASGGALGGFSAPGGKTTKQRLLELERAASVEKLPLFAPR